MIQKIEALLAKKIKQHIYGKSQTIHAIFPAGFAEIALAEVNHILKNFWFEQKNIGEILLTKNVIRITQIHLFAITELLIRNQCLTDIRLVIFEGKAAGKSAFAKKCHAIRWEFYLNQNMTVKIKVNSVASHAFHETGLKKIISDIIKEHVFSIFSGESTDETTCLYVDFYKDKLTISISLAGNPFYKRGYRGTLSASAPLREDLAACCIKKAFALHPDFIAHTVLIPFSGTGTFAFEYLLKHFHISPALLGREYALEKMPLFRKEHFSFLLKKAGEHCLLNHSLAQPTIFCIDNSPNANAALLENIQAFNNAIQKKNLFSPTHLLQTNVDDFFEFNIIDNKNWGNIFIPLNPPYGIRLNKKSDPIDLYRKIAEKINFVSQHIKQTAHHLLGFVLCPSEETWLAFHKAITHVKTKTYHFTQGGIDIRICIFY